MSYIVNIKYTRPVADAEQLVQPICSLFAPTGSYIDSEAYAGTVYDTNVEGFGQAVAPEQFMAASIAHPGIIGQFKFAAENGETEFEVTDHATACYYYEVGKALESQGFQVTIPGLVKEAAEEDTTEPVTGGGEPVTGEDDSDADAGTEDQVAEDEVAE